MEKGLFFHHPLPDDGETRQDLRGTASRMRLYPLHEYFYGELPRYRSAQRDSDAVEPIR